MTMRNAFLAVSLLVSSAMFLKPTLLCAAESDPVIFTFATVGDSRQDPEAEGISGADKRWHQNTPALARILREIQTQRPYALFFNGDMIYGYSTNRPDLDREYAYWRGMVAGLIEAGTYVVPVPGNHEVQLKVKGADGVVRKTACAPSEEAWRANMGDLILDTALWRRLRGAEVAAWDVQHTPAIGGADQITSDQRQLTFAFDDHDLHFVVINTDATGQDSHAPVAWLAKDLELAKQRGVRRSFVFGHKMAYTYHYGDKVEPKGLDAHPDNQRAFWDLMERYGATYFCGHEHVYHSSQPRSNAGGHAWQIISGSGGSPFEAKPGQSTNPKDRYYAWAFVRVHQSGRVQLTAHGFDERFGPTELIEKLELAPGTTTAASQISSPFRNAVVTGP